MEHTKEIITVSDAAKLCKVTRATIWRWIKSGLLNAGVTAGGHYRILLEDLHKLIKSKDMNCHSRASSTKYRILVVDDESAVREVLGKALNRSGFEVAYATDGFEAGLKTVKFQPDIIILDLFMPKMDGFEVCKQLKKNIDSVDIKIIAISGDENTKNQQRIFSCGADRFFLKPLNLKKLISEVNHLLGMI
ncbi:response regulator [bacterium]|nr:response regulator [bacterium]